MGPEDVRVWTRYLQQRASSLEEVWYDLHVGTPMSVPAGMDESMQRVADAVSRKRIDVVARVGTGFWIIEVKPVCNTEALGQAINYVTLFRKEYPGPEALIPVVVCEQVEVDVIDTSDLLGVLVFAIDGILE
jgi:hypothetical protein